MFTVKQEQYVYRWLSQSQALVRCNGHCTGNGATLEAAEPTILACGGPGRFNTLTALERSLAPCPTGRVLTRDTTIMLRSLATPPCSSRAFCAQPGIPAPCPHSVQWRGGDMLDYGMLVTRNRQGSTYVDLHVCMKRRSPGGPCACTACAYRLVRHPPGVSDFSPCPCQPHPSASHPDAATPPPGLTRLAAPPPAPCCLDTCRASSHMPSGGIGPGRTWGYTRRHAHAQAPDTVPYWRSCGWAWRVGKDGQRAGRRHQHACRQWITVHIVRFTHYITLHAAMP